MFKRGFSVAACGALALLLTAVQTSPAEFFPYVTFPVGRGGTIGAFGPTSYSYYPGYFGSPYYRSSYNNPYYGGYNPSYYQSAYSSYSVNTVTPLYYGSAGFAPSYNTAYSPARLVSPSLSSLAAINRAESAAYSTPIYPLRSPDYHVIYPVSPPLSEVADNTAHVEVLAPADAQIWFDGHATTQTGTERSYTSPALEPHQAYVYDVRAHWEANGKSVDQTRQVTVHAGDSVVVDFHQAVAAK